MLPIITIRNATKEDYHHILEEKRHHFGNIFGDDAKTMFWPKHASKPIVNTKVIEIDGVAGAIVGEQYIGAGYWTGITKQEKEILKYHRILQYHFEKSVRQTGLIVPDKFRNNHQLIARMKAAHIISLFKRGYSTVFDQTMLEISTNPAREILYQLRVNPKSLPEYQEWLLYPCMRIPRGNFIGNSASLVNMKRRDRVQDSYQADKYGYDVDANGKDNGSPAVTVYWANPFTVPRITNQMFQVTRSEIDKIIGQFNKYDITSEEVKSMQIILRAYLLERIA